MTPTCKKRSDPLAHLAAVKLQALLAAGLLFCCLPAWADSSQGNPTRLWSAPDKELVLYIDSEAGGYSICPRMHDMTRQPFCRAFDAPVLGACGLSDRLQLVLSNGEVHRVNSALIGTNGGFEPAHRPKQPLDLVKAWMPEEICDTSAGLSNIMAVGSSGSLWHFDGQNWQQISEHRVGATNQRN
jgi:hypothetical protein